MKMFLSALLAAVAVSLLSGTSIARADEDNDHRNAYVVTPLVSDLKGAAANQDPVLQNAWGVAFTPAGSPFWIADNATGCSTLYGGDGTKVALQVSIPLPGLIETPSELRAFSIGMISPFRCSVPNLGYLYVLNLSKNRAFRLDT